MTRRFALAALAALSISAPLRAQRAPAPAPAQPVLEPGKRIRVETSGGPRLEGRFERYEGDSLVLRTTDASRVAVPVPSLTAVWVRGNALKTGAIVGGAAGAVVTGFLVGGLCGLARNEDGIPGNEGVDAGCAAAGAGIGLVVGGGVGAGVGALIPRWRRAE